MQPFYGQGTCPHCGIQKFGPIGLGAVHAESFSTVVFKVEPPFHCQNCGGAIATFEVTRQETARALEGQTVQQC